MVYGDDKRACKHCIERGGLLDNFPAVRLLQGFAHMTLWISNSLSTSGLAGRLGRWPGSFVGVPFFFKNSTTSNSGLQIFRGGFCGSGWPFFFYLFT
jgi:hypothetical protein